MELKDYINKNPSLLFSEKRLHSLLSDIYRNDQLSINLMMNAFSIGIISEMRESFPVESFTITKWSKKLVADFGVNADNAKWAIDTWISIIDSELLKKLDTTEELSRIDQEELKKKQEEEARILAEKEKQRIEAEEQAREEARRSMPDSRLKTREDYDDYYINPSIIESEDRVYIPCGFGQGDNGFFICGIKKELVCTHKDANIYALVYNYLVRSSTISEDDIPRCIQSIETVYEIDYKSVYRLSITILQMIRHNYVHDTLELDYSDEGESLKYAVFMINHYAALFCRLIGIQEIKLDLKISKKGVPLSLYGKKGIHIVDNTEIVSNARELWYGRKIYYHLNKSNLPDLEYILREISDFDGFKEGQFSALRDMLSCKKHSVCIMPTGSGKSLIFYMASLLQPLPMFVVSPTDILIQDQLRNLKEFHRIDNAAHLRLTEENSFADWEICNSLNYITPMTFQNRHLLVKFRYLNDGTRLVDKRAERIAQGSLVSYIVLDEIHCLSNWGHDFRPEYLMLSKYLIKFFDHISFWGFTATANYTVVEDVQKQLNIPQDNFFSPIAFEHYNISYDFRAFHTENEMLNEIATITAPMIRRNERTIVFTKNESVSERVADAIGWEADVFSNDNPSAYYHFAQGKSKILVASDELGIGINLPNIRNVIHFGLPLSKNEYVQEIGRAGRANENVRSYVLYLDTSPENVPDGLLKRNTPINKLPSLMEGYNNDYTFVYQKLSNGAISDERMYEDLIQMYRYFVDSDRAMYVESYPRDILNETKQKLYMLYLTGFVNDWYSYSQTKDGSGVDILVDICSTDADKYRKSPAVMLNRMKERMRSYFEYMGNNREAIVKAERSKTPEEIILVYVKWYYERYLYHHNEQFLDFFDFLTENLSSDNDKITEEIKDYFVLPFAKLKSDEALYNELSIKEIISKTTAGVGKNTLINLERINSNRYSVKLDLALLCGNLRMNGMFDESRLERILFDVPKEEIPLLSNALCYLYSFGKTESKIHMLNYVERAGRSLKISYIDFLEKIYSNGIKDEIYYGIVANMLNKHFVKMRRACHV